MKVALCFAGQPRNVESTFHGFIKPNIIDVNQHHQIDTYVHMWYDQSQENKAYINSGGHPCSLPVPPDCLNMIYRLYDPVQMSIQRQLVFAYPPVWDTITYPDIKVANSLSRMFSTKQVVELCFNSGRQYDLIAIGRFDSIVRAPVLFDNLNTPKMFDLGLAPHGINILWMFAPPQIMHTYTQMVHRLQEVIADGVPFCDEYLIKHYLQKCNIPLEPLNIPASINTEHL